MKKKILALIVAFIVAILVISVIICAVFLFMKSFGYL